VAERLTFDDDGTLDELVAFDAHVHLEHLGDGEYMLIVQGDELYVNLSMLVKRSWRGVPKIVAGEVFGLNTPDSGRETER
jgi:hypothetical protein